MELPGYVGVAVSPNSADISGVQLPRVSCDLNFLERSVASKVRVPRFFATMANIFIPTGGFAFACHLKVFDAYDVARMVRAHCEFRPTVNAPPDIYQPCAAG